MFWLSHSTFSSLLAFSGLSSWNDTYFIFKGQIYPKLQKPNVMKWAVDHSSSTVIQWTELKLDGNCDVHSVELVISTFHSKVSFWRCWTHLISLLEVAFSRDDRFLILDWLRRCEVHKDDPEPPQDGSSASRHSVIPVMETHHDQRISAHISYCLSSSRLTRTRSPPRTIRTVCCHLTGVADGSGVLVEPAEPISSSGCNISADLYKISAYECRYMKIRSIISMFLCLHGTNGCSLTGRCYWDRFCITHTNLCLEIITQQLQVQLNIYSH